MKSKKVTINKGNKTLEFEVGQVYKVQFDMGCPGYRSPYDGPYVGILHELKTSEDGDIRLGLRDMMQLRGDHGTAEDPNGGYHLSCALDLVRTFSIKEIFAVRKVNNPEDYHRDLNYFRKRAKETKRNET